MRAKHKSSLLERANEGLTVGRLVGGILAVVAIFGAVWGLDNHWQTRGDAVSHAQKDEQRGAWSSYNLRNNRLEYLGDKQYECDQRKAAGKSDGIEEGLCARFRTQHENVTKEVADLKSKAQDAGKEKQ